LGSSEDWPRRSQSAAFIIHWPVLVGLLGSRREYQRSKIIALYRNESIAVRREICFGLLPVNKLKMKGLPLDPPRRVFSPSSRPQRKCITALFTLLAFLLASILLSVLLSFSPCLTLWPSTGYATKCYRGYRSDFSFDAGDRLHPAWMAAIPDATNITSLSVPGTHDTMTYDIVDQVFQCQNRNLSTQLNAGLRYLDIRARQVNDALEIYHGEKYTGYSFEYVLLTVFEFLDQNPSESIIMRVKKESGKVGRSPLTYEDVFNLYRFNNTATMAGSAKHFYLPEDGNFHPLPTLGQLRGKILILQDYPSTFGASYGVGWSSDAIVLEDLWIIPSVDHLYMKWDAISNALRNASESPDNNQAIFLAHLSASVGVLPIEAAAGPPNRTDIIGMNEMTGRWLEAPTEIHGRAGVVIIDFPGQRLIDAVLKRNEPLMA
jgi:1-phosphatidylinositol phosphodiesterase